jgi:hypothetical protein
MALSQITLLYQVTPIILTGGIADNISGGMLPLLALTNPNAFSDNLLSGNENFELDDAFAIFQPAVGGSLVEQTIATYPFANLSVAANAIIRNPINVSMIMITPMKQLGSWSQKLSIMSALKATLDSHNNAGGTYTVCTPAYTFIDMLLVNLIDCSMAQSPIPQNAWRWDFTRPLVSLADASGVQSNLMNQISNGVAPPGSDSSITGQGTALTSAPSTTNQAPGAGGSAPVVSTIPIGAGAGNTLEAPTGVVATGDDTPSPLGWSVTVTPPGGSQPNLRRRL